MLSMFGQDLANLQLFQGLSQEQLERLMSLMEPMFIPEKQIVFEQGQAAEYLYILIKGEVEIRYKPYDGPPLTVVRITPGGVFGWSASLGRKVYTSAAIALTECETYRISGHLLHHLCNQAPDIGGVLLDRLAGVIAERLRNTHSQVLTILTEGMDLNGDCWRKPNDDH
jgi:CRP-like cAMP-binding protein